MNCDDVQDRLDDHVDNLLAPNEAREVQSHLRECAACAEEERLLRALLAEAAALPAEREPSRDLWPGIAQRIRAGQVVSFGSRERSLRRPWLLAAAAAALVALTAAVTTLVVRERPRGPQMAAAPSPSGPSGAPLGAGTGPDPDGRVRPVDLDPDAGFEGAEAEYVRAARSLEESIRSRESALTPETVAVVEKNLRVIDEALEQVRVALRKDPGSRELMRLLVATHQRKVAVLRRVAKLTT